MIDRPNVPDPAELTGAPQEWLRICASTLAEAPDQLPVLLSNAYPYEEVFANGRTRWYDRDPMAPEGYDVPDVGSARAVLAVAQALAEPQQAVALLEPALAHWRRANVLPDVPGMSLPPEAFNEVDAKLRGVLQRAEEIGGPAAGLVALLAVHLSGGELRRSRPVEVPVLFDRNTEGGTAVLSLSVVENGPFGLYPDPACMLFLVSDAAFGRSLTAAWRASAQDDTQRCIVWSIKMRAEPCNDVVHDSLGAAFGACLDELRRSTARFGRLRLRRLHPRRAITGGLTDDGTLTAIGGLDTKFAAAAGARLRVVLPKVQEAEAEQLGTRHTELRKGLYFAGTLDDVLANARWFDARQVALSLLVALLVFGGVGTAVGINHYNGTEVARSKLAAQASELTARATLLRETDPRLAGLLALAAHRLSPGAQGNVDALRDILAANGNVLRSWKASPSAVDAIAVDVTRSRVYTSGDDGAVKAWNLDTGVVAGQAPDSTGRLVLSPYAPVLAAVDDRRIRLFNVESGSLELQGRLPENFCGARESTIIAADFVESGATVLATWSDGSVTSWDTVTREAGDCWLLRDVATAAQLGELRPGRLVLDASVIPSEEAYRGGEDRLLLLLNQNRVLDVGVRKHRVTVALSGDELTADATHVRGTAERLAVGTSAGVLLWDRATKRNLAFPLGALSAPVTALDFRNDQLVIGSADGAAVVPDFLDSAGTGRSITTPRGGRADVATVGKDDTIVTGGPGGRVTVLRSGGGDLTLPSLAPASTATYTPDGSLLLNDWSQGRSATLFTVQPTGAPSYAGRSGNEYEHITVYNAARRFYVNDTAASPGLVAAVGQVGDDTAAVVVWPASGGDSRELVIPSPDDAVREDRYQIGVHVALVPEAKLLLARHLSGQVAIWNTDTWQMADPIDLRPGTTNMVVHGTRGVFSEGGDEQTELVLIDLVTRAELRRVPAPGNYRLAWSANGRRIVAMRDGNQLTAYDAELRPVGAPWRLPDSDPGGGVAVSPDGNRVAVSQGSRVRVYDLATTAEAMPALVEPDDNDVVVLTWSPDGSTVLGLTLPPRRELTKPGPVRRWLVTDRDWSAQVCRWTGGGLSRDEWRRNVGEGIEFIDLCRGAK